MRAPFAVQGLGSSNSQPATDKHSTVARAYSSVLVRTRAYSSVLERTRAYSSVCASTRSAVAHRSRNETFIKGKTYHFFFFVYGIKPSKPHHQIIACLTTDHGFIMLPFSSSPPQPEPRSMSDDV